MNKWMRNASRVATFDFANEGAVDYLKRNGLYLSSTYFSFVHSLDIFWEINSKAVSLLEQKACQHLKKGLP